MADERAVVVRAGRLVFEEGDDALWLGFDAGEWTLESRCKVRGFATTGQMRLAPAAMDALIATWPGFKAGIEQ